MLNTSRAVSRLVLLVVSAVLAACGGGSGPSGSAAAGSDLQPVAVGSAPAPAPSPALIPAPAQTAPSPQPASTALAWSNPATWGGSKPVAGAAVVIPAGMQVMLDEDTPALGPLTVEGELSFKSGANVELRAQVVHVRANGALRAGSATAPHAGRATITLTATDTTDDANGMGTRGILVSAGGKLELFGTAPAVTWTKLNAHAEAGATTLTLERAVDWRAGDQIVVAPTEWYGPVWVSQSVHDASTATERRSLSASTSTSASSANLSLSSALTNFRWGRQQYATDTGMSLTRGGFTKPHVNAADTLDERAEVGNLSRNIVIQSVDDALWRNSGFGAQVMVMDRRSSLQLDGVELRRVGQAGKVGRYPIHWHMLSYAADGSSLGDASGHFVRNSSVWDSRQRCMVLHGTNGVSIQNNICYDIKGHAIFLEDAVERRNVIEGNLVLRVRSPLTSLAVTEHEKSGHMCGASAGYWLTNPDNTVRNNAVADAQGNGFWLSYPQRPVKQNKLVPLRPQNMRHGAFEFNSARSNGNVGLMLECAMTDDAGNLELLSYSPTTDGSVFNYENGVRFEIKGITTAKNNGGYVNRAITPDYVQWMAADNLGRAFSGAVQYGSTLKHSLLVGKSLNDRQAYPADAEPQLGVASYHSQMDIAQNSFVNLENRGFVLTSNGGDLASGAFGTNDYYIRPVEKGFWRNPGNKFINADAGYRALPPHLQPDYTPQTLNNWTLSGAIWDPQGYWGTAGRFWVLDSPFLRDDSCTSIVTRSPAGRANALSCAGPYYGVTGFYFNRGLPTETNVYQFMETLDVTRQDSGGNTLGRWRIEQGHTSNFLGHMRHFAAVKGGIYVMRFPSFPQAATTKAPPRWLSLNVENMTAAGDSMLLGVHFDTSAEPSKVLVSTSPDNPDLNRDARRMTAAASRAAVAASNGDRYWRDTANGLIWVKLMPIGAAEYNGSQAGSDDELYRPYTLRIER